MPQRCASQATSANVSLPIRHGSAYGQERVSYEVFSHPLVKSDVESLPNISQFNEPWGDLYREIERLETEGADVLVGGSRVPNEDGMYLHQIIRDPLVAFICSDNRQTFYLVAVASPGSEQEWGTAKVEAVARLQKWLALSSD